MFCTHCGQQLGASPASFCTQCGRPAGGEIPPAAGPQPQVIRFHFHGDGATLFGISLKVFLLTLVTLGVYSFWGVVKKRRYMYSQTELAGQRFHFDGKGEELLIGWLKAMGVLLVLGLQAGLMQLLLGRDAGTLVGNLVWQLGIFLLIPLIIVGAWRYRLSRSSYRGIRFSFRGRAIDCYGIYLLGVLLSAITLSLYLPIFTTNLRRYLVTNSHWGTLKFEFDGRGKDLLLPWICTLLLAIPTLGLSFVWFEGRRQIYYWQHSAFEGARFQTAMTPLGYAAISVLTAVLTIVTLGIASPWAAVMKAQYISDNLSIGGSFDLTRIQQRAMPAGATGEELAGVLDIEAAGFEL